MLARLSAILLVVALPVFAAPSPGTISSSGQGCSTGSLHCCNDLQPVANPANQTLAGTLGAAIGSLAVQLGLDCTPVGVAGGAGQECNAQSACCSSGTYNGILTLGCLPFNLNA